MLFQDGQEGYICHTLISVRAQSQISQVRMAWSISGTPFASFPPRCSEPTTHNAHNIHPVFPSVRVRIRV